MDIHLTDTDSGESRPLNRKAMRVPDEISTGEIGRRLDFLTREVHEMRSRVEGAAILGAQMLSLDRRVSSMEDTQRWLVRIVIGAVVLALLGLIIVQGGRP